MQELNKDNIFLLAHLIEEYIKEVEGENLSNTLYILNNMAATIKSRTGAVFCDDTKKPTYFFWLIKNQSPTINRTVGLVSLIYVAPEKRGSGVPVVKMLEQIEKTAKENDCDMLAGASWALGPLEKEAQDMWEKSGFKKTETTFTKEI